MIGEALPDFQVMNPDLVICNLHPGSGFQMELHLGKGRGYVPAEENRPEEAPLGLIAIDSIFTPIKNVKYNIENTRVEQRTDFEKLIMEVITDGTIHPEEAVKEASRILIQHLMIITDENISLDTRREEKETVRAFNCLKAAKINSLSELVQYTQEELMKFRNFGQKSLSEIEQVLHERGLHFGMDINKFRRGDD
jgi:DNA-directed RNA polymerase subunit alpha